jgi:thiol-disulfide isomerase/thioredoxin
MKIDRRWMKGVLLATAGIFFITGLVTAKFWNKPKKDKPKDDKVDTSKLAADFKATDVTSGKKITLSAYKGKVVVLNFWATWCPPCVGEIPDLIKLNKTYGDKLVVLGASVDNGPDVAKDFVKKNKVDFPVFMADSAMQKAYGGIPSIPTTFIINANGEIVEKIVGGNKYDVFVKKVKPYLTENIVPTPPTPDKPDTDAKSKYDFKGQDVINGKNVSLSDYKGKPVIVNFFATWCGPCVSEIPGFVNLQKKYDGKIQFIGLSVDDESGVVKKFIKNKGINFPVIMSKSEIESAYGGVSSIPVTVILDGKGNLIEKIVGGISESVMESKIKKAIK